MGMPRGATGEKSVTKDPEEGLEGGGVKSSSYSSCRANMFKSGEDCGELEVEYGEAENTDAGLPVTQSDDPRSGGHLALGMSKAPLWYRIRRFSLFE